MRIRFFIPLVLLVLAAGLAWPDFYSGLAEKDRRSLAESYYLAGSQYVSVGKGEVGREYQALAYKIYPELVPAGIAEEKLPSAQELLASGMAKMIAPQEASGLAPRSFFLRYLGALLEQDPAAAAAFMDGSVYLTDESREFTREEAEQAYAALFSTQPLAGMDPSAVYDLSSLKITAAPEKARTLWGAASLITVNARQDFSSALPFWSTDQRMLVRKEGGSWYIFAMGSALPPADWKPQAIPAAAERPVAESEKALVKEITDAFQACVSAFLDKNADEATAYIAEQVRVVRLRQTISRQELATTFLGYFDSADFAGAGFDSVVEPASIFVERSTEFSDGSQGPVYVLNVKARHDLSDRFPFWTAYQRYFFSRGDGGWKIFALF